MLYQIYPRSFADSNADGVGDLQGIIEHLDYLHWLGIDAIWLSPITVSPERRLGLRRRRLLRGAARPRHARRVRRADRARRTERDDPGVARLRPQSHERTARVVRRRRVRRGPRRFRDWYVWADPAADGSPPNNWVSSFGGPAWTLDDATGQYYLHNHLREQPDLNWWNDEVRATFDDITPLLVRPRCRRLPHRRLQHHRQGRASCATTRPRPTTIPSDVADVRATPGLQRETGPRCTTSCGAGGGSRSRTTRRGSCWARRPSTTRQRWLRSTAPHLDELQLAFNFPFINAPFEAAAMRDVVERIEAHAPAGRVARVDRLESRHVAVRDALGARRPAQSARRAAHAARPARYARALPGRRDRPRRRRRRAARPARSARASSYWPAYAGRDAMRTPMPWRDAPGRGLHRTPMSNRGSRSATPSLQRREPAGRPGVDARARPRSHRAARSARPIWPSVPTRRWRLTPDGVWAWRRGERHAVVVNYTDADVELEGFRGRIVVGTDRARDGEAVSGTLATRGWEGCIVDLGAGRSS